MDCVVLRCGEKKHHKYAYNMQKCLKTAILWATSLN